ncbi:hypothetical protein [Microlunatus antarcticus]|uniref:Mce-associated membrane protein n=1 Tax=Microlunatus antarcticus TaxID=53388 RepID=A0A7W5P5S4_9ACTN|nr:hypothetical protein [Microlunatus antarcticus]MBB3325703.1 hypothetical protein [Microlunatus antarcticus]
MNTRIAKALAAGTVMALPLLSACGASTTPAESSAAPVAPAASATSAAATPSPSATPVDETKNVKAAAETFMKTAFGIDGQLTYDEYQDRVRPLMTKAGYASFETADFEEGLKKFRARYGQQARNVTEIRKTSKVEKLTEDKATVSVTYKYRTQQRKDGEWRTIRSSGEDAVEIPLVKQDGRWLVDDLG